jgi:glycosyltransferase involved in cell wall biosynthesis
MLTLIVIAKNEADRIGGCLASVPFADEIVVLDSGSSDETVSVARAHGARVIQTDWPGYVAQKNRGLEAAAGPWVLSLDADERLSEAAAVEVAAFLNSIGSFESIGAQCAGLSFPRRNRWLGFHLRWGRPGFERKVRLVRKGRAVWRGDDPHDVLHAAGPVQRLRGAIFHDSCRSFDEAVATAVEYARIGAHGWRAKRRRGAMLRMFTSPLWALFRGVVLQGGVLDGVPGLAYAWLDATSRFLKYAWVILPDLDSPVRGGAGHGRDRAQR